MNLMWMNQGTVPSMYSPEVANRMISSINVLLVYLRNLQYVLHNLIEGK